MNRFLKHSLAGAVLSVCLAADAARPPTFWQENQALTRTVPSGSTRGTDAEGDALGLDLSNLMGLRIHACGIGGNLQAAGTVRFALFSMRNSKWELNPSLAHTITVTGQACEVWDLQAVLQVGDIVVAYTDSITLSAGTSVSILIEGQPRNL